ITGSAAFQVWCAQSEEFQILERCLVFTGEAGTLEQARKVRIADDVLRDGVTAIRARIRAAIAKHMIGDALHLDSQIALFLMEESLAVGNEILEIAKLRPVDGRVVDLRDDAVPDGEPKMTGRTVRCPYAGFVAVRPSGLDAGFSKRFGSNDSLHPRTSPLPILKIGIGMQMVNFALLAVRLLL